MAPTHQRRAARLAHAAAAVVALAAVAVTVDACCVNADSSVPTEFQNCGGNRYAGLPFATRSPVYARNGAAATSVSLASQIALDILKAGGNAIDAAIAANAAQGLMEPVGNGIGGDLFAIVYHAATNTIYGLNGSGRSPAGQTWEEILAPTVAYALEGFPVGQVVSRSWRSSINNYLSASVQLQITSNGRYPNAFDGFRDTFTINGNRGPNDGEVFRNPELANTLELIANNGRDEFYSGNIAREIDEWARNVAGLPLRYEDFAAHRGEWVTPLNTTYRNVRVFELPPNGQGLAALQILNILEGFDLKEYDFNSVDHLHLVTEAKKLAYADRAAYYADPDFADIPVERLLSKEYAAERRALIDMSRAAQRVDAGELREGDTIYLTTADKEGNMVSLIQSNYRGMGAGIAVPGLGFGFQDRGEMFNVQNRSHPNAYEPAKRPFHTIIPAFATKDEKPWLSFGVMGGDMQPQGHVQIISNLIDFGMNVQEAGDAARWRHTGDSEPTGEFMTDGGSLYVERGVCQQVRDALTSRGHRMRSGGDYGGYQAILRENLPDGSFTYRAASEMRKDGQAVGY